MTADDPREPLEEIRRQASRGTYSAGGRSAAGRDPEAVDPDGAAVPESRRDPTGSPGSDRPDRSEESGGPDDPDHQPAFHPPPALEEIAQTLESRGYEAWTVGGAVRDALLGQDRADWDLATDARPQDVQRVFRRTVPVGVEHGTVGVLGSDEEMYEVTTFRRDVETDGRHAVVEYATRIEDDLARRDFTINALAWRPATDDFRDPFGGRGDMRQRVLRAVGEPRERFHEDYLRVLRGLRFAGRFELRIDEPTREAMAEAADHLDELSAERIREELMKVLADRTPSTALRLYGEYGVLDRWYPELVDAYRRDPRRELYLSAVDHVSRGRPILRLARWLVPVADDEDARVQAATEILERLKCSNAETERVCHLLLHYRPLVSPADSAAQIREWLSAVGREQVNDIFRLHFADARASGADQKIRYLIHLWRRAREEARSDPPLSVSELAVDGNDLMEIGVQQGPAVGILLDELLARVIEEPELNERDALLEVAEELKEMGGLDRLVKHRERGEGDAGTDTGSDAGT